ncbi:g2069 [Coccomyxa elongata]
MYSIGQDAAAGLPKIDGRRTSTSRRTDEDGNEEFHEEEVDEFEELKRAAMEEYEQSQHTFKYPLAGEGNEKVVVIDVRAMGRKGGSEHRKLVVDRALATKDQDNERFYRNLRARFDRVGIELSKVEVRFERLAVEADVHVGGRGLPTVLNSVRNFVETNLQKVHLMRNPKKKFQILNGVNGVLKPGRLTLLLGPPGSGKTTLLKALAGKLQGKSPRVSGRITYNGETFDRFVPQRTAAYVSQVDNHIAELTVRETLDFAARVLGVGHKAEYLRLLREREKAAGLRGDPETDAYLKASALQGKRHSVVTEYMLRLLGLDVCADTIVGNQMIRGISGGQRKRVTTGEMVVGPMKTLFLDEISTGLDSSTTYLITKCIRNFVHMQDATVLLALLQPAPETFDLFDDIMLLSEGHIVYFGPREGVMPFFNNMGFALPARKGIADFLQEVTSRKDQGQYWADRTRPYEFVPVQAFSRAFEGSEAGRGNAAALAEPYHAPGKMPLDALVRTKYALSGWQAFKACLRREWTLMVRHKFIYIFRTCQVSVVSTVIATLFLRTTLNASSVSDGQTYLGLIFFAIIHMMFNAYSEMSIMVGTLPGFYKQRDAYFYPAWAASLPTALLRLPYSFVESLVLSCIIYWVAGLAPEAGRFFYFWLIMFLLHQMSVGMFRLMGAIGRTIVIATTMGSTLVLFIVTLSGFVLAHPQIHPWTIWGFWISPLMYAQQALSINEFRAARWQSPYGDSTVGLTVLNGRGLFTADWWRWLSIGALLGFAILFNIAVLVAQTFLNPVGAAAGSIPEEVMAEREFNRTGSSTITGPKKASPRKNDTRAAPDAHSDSLTGASFRRSLRAIVPGGSPKRQDHTNGSSDTQDIEMGAVAQENGPGDSVKAIKGTITKGMILPFQPMALTFHDVCYFVPLPKEMARDQGSKPDQGPPMLQLLHNVSGAFQPGILTALVGVSGAGKTTLLDVLAGRKTGGKVMGDIRLDGHPKEQSTFARVCGYVEQNDIHSPQVTVEESLMFSAQLRLMNVSRQDLRTFVNEVMALVELTPLKGSLVGVPGSTGLSVEQRKRLTIAVELVANPSVIFMDEPTTGLDARAAAIVMRTVRNTVNTGRTVVCTIHQPSIDIFEAFDDLLLLKRGGHPIYVGHLGVHSVDLVRYFQTIPGVPPLGKGINPATWMLEVSTLAKESQLGVDFAEIYRKSDLFRENEELIARLAKPATGSRPLHFKHAFPQSQPRQLALLLKKNMLTYWRSPFYNTVRFAFTIALGLIIGAIYWDLGDRRNQQGDVLNIMGAIFVAVIFLGTSNSSTVQPVVAIERTVMYRERAAGMYGVIPYAIAQGAVEFPWALGQSIVYSCITYFMIHFEFTAAKFFWYLLFSYLTLLYFTFYGMMAVAVSPSVQLAAVISSAFYSIWFLFTGFLIPRPRMPVWWRWYSYLDPVAWTLSGVIGSQLGDVEDIINVQGQNIPVNQYVSETYGFDKDSLWYTVLVLLGFSIVFWFVVAGALKFLNYQKR